MKPAKLENNRVGFFGKVPTHGDFVSGGLEERLRAALDSWVQEGLASCEHILGHRWQALFHACPPWRFVVKDHHWISQTIAGMLLPSRDRVGRCFPFIIAAQLGNYCGDPRQLCHDKTWFVAAEALAETSHTGDFDLERLSAGLKRLRLPQAQAHSISDVQESRQSTGADSSVWWTCDPDTGRAHGFKTAGLPKGSDFLKLLEYAVEPSIPSLQTETAGPIAASASLRTLPVPSPDRLMIERSYATHPGTRLFINSDALLISDEPSLFVIADGMGDNISAAEAAKVTIKTLAGTPFQETLGALVQEVQQKLGHAQGLLQAASKLGRHEEAPKVSVSVLAVLDDAFAVVSSGDVRCYLMRDGMMCCLTRDHLQIGLHRQLSRCVGGHGSLVPDVINKTLRNGDRLLLCSASLPRALGERSVARILHDVPLHETSSVLIQEALIANVRDNISAIVLEARSE